jgi:CheY-like chemotaxis protein
MGLCCTPVCYFPSKVIFIDDSKDFLVNFSLQLQDLVNYQLYDSPQHALQAICFTAPEKQLHRRCLSQQFQYSGNPLTNQGVNIDLSAIHSELYNAKRFAETTVAVVDYAMPSMTGLEFCEKTHNTPVRKILLTGRTDEKVAVSAFNAGLIDYFVQKNDADLCERILTYIAQLQTRYFQEMSDLLVTMLTLNGLQCLRDTKFATFFTQLRQQHKIVEYYLTTTSGSFLLVDAHGNASYLIVGNEEDMQYGYEFAIDNHAPPEVIQRLQDRSHITCNQLLDGQYTETDINWFNMIYPAERLEGQLQPYYYSLVKQSIPFEVDKDKIITYRRYLDTLVNIS